MFQKWDLNKKTNRLHERCLRVTYNNKNYNFEKLLENDSSVTTHYRHNQTLAIEIYKVVRGISPEIMNEIFQSKGESHVDLRYTETVARMSYCKNAVFKNLAKFTGNGWCLRPATLLKKWLWHRCFPVNFANFLRTYFFIEHLRWVLLVIHLNSSFHPCIVFVMVASLYRI